MKALSTKSLLAALASLTLVAAPAAASAQHHGGGGGGGGGTGGGGGWHGGGGGTGGGGHWSGGGHWNGGGGWHGGGWSGGGWGWRDHGHGCWGCFGGFAFGLALGSAWDPWYWDAPYYGYPAYTVIERDYGYPDGGYYYDRYNRAYGDAPPPPPTYAAPAAPACGQWQWDAGRQQYNWIPCAAPPPPPR